MSLGVGGSGRQRLARLATLAPAQLGARVGRARGPRRRQLVLVLVAALRERRMLTVPAAENTLRLLPPLVISDEEIGIALDLMALALADWA